MIWHSEQRVTVISKDYHDNTTIYNPLVLWLKKK